MGENSKIAWTDHTWNPWWGCTKVSEGCAHCYAEAQAARFGDWFGPGKRRRGMSTTYWNDPLRWNRKAHAAGARAKVFCGSMCDLFEDVESGLVRFEDGCIASVAEERALAFDIMEHTDSLDWILCTKRVENVMGMVPEHWRERFPENVWMLVTAENQERLEERAGKLLGIPAKVRGLSIEPMLGEMDLLYATYDGSESFSRMGGLDWVIVGAEKGDGRRSCPLWWVESVVRQCRDSGVAVFVKQLELGGRISQDMAEWPRHLRVQEFPWTFRG